MTKRIQRRRAATLDTITSLVEAAATQPRFRAALAHRVVTTLCHGRTDPFYGCAFPTCTTGPVPTCTSRCAIYDAGHAQITFTVPNSPFTLTATVETTDA